MVATLPCDLRRPIRQRILLDENSLERLFKHLQDLHEENIAIADEPDRPFIIKRPPVVEVSYEDGTVYEVQDTATLKEIIPGKGKSIKSIEVGTAYGSVTCRVYFKDYSFDPVVIRSSGPEDKITHLVDTIVMELTRDSDITVFARKIWPTAWAFLISLLIWLPLGWRAVHDYSTAYGLVIITLITGFFLLILLDLFWRRWLKPVAFLWGIDGRRAQQAKSIVTAVLVTLPVWLMGI